MPSFIRQAQIVLSNNHGQYYSIGFDEKGRLYIDHDGVKSYVVLSLTAPDETGRITPPTYGDAPIDTPKAIPLTLEKLKTIWDYLKDEEL